MKLSAEREALLAPLQTVIGVVERRQTMPILSNVLLAARAGMLSVTATDLEVELVATAEMDIKDEGEITVPGRKLLDICRALPDKATITMTQDGDRMLVSSGRSRFSLATLPATEFPTVEDINAQQTLCIEQGAMKHLLEKTHFSMAQQDVRYYLNGLLLECDGNRLRAVATDGHRLALCDVELGADAGPAQQVIIPRKGVLELQRLLGEDREVIVQVGSNHIRAELNGTRFTSKLIDGRFPEYERVIPSEAGATMQADREILRHALQRTAILSNEKYRGIRLDIRGDTLVIQANNPEHEEAHEEVAVEYAGDEIEIGFNVNYLLDALGAVDNETVEVGLLDANSSCLIREPGSDICRYVVMPMRL